ncbi:MAG: DUF6544 family protein [Candidatus Promineifilaceae bacterium]
MKNSFRRQVAEMFRTQGDGRPAEIITEADIVGLPEPVRRYMRTSQIIGKARVQAVRLKQKGFMRMNPDQRWIPLTAEEYYTVDPPAFIWYGRARIMPLVFFEAVDRYSGGSGNMMAKLLSFIKVVDASGIEMDQGAMMRYLNEMMWFPTALLGDSIHWEPIDDNSARAVFSNDDKSVSAEFHFDELGRITNFIADRYRSVGKEWVLEKWSTPVSTFAEWNGLMLPVTGEAYWHLDTGDFSYIKIEIVDLEYNNPAGYWQD